MKVIFKNLPDKASKEVNLDSYWDLFYSEFAGYKYVQFENGDYYIKKEFSFFSNDCSINVFWNRSLTFRIWIGPNRLKIDFSHNSVDKICFEQDFDKFYLVDRKIDYLDLPSFIMGNRINNFFVAGLFRFNLGKYLNADSKEYKILKNYNK